MDGGFGNENLIAGLAVMILVLLLAALSWGAVEFFRHM